MSKEEKEKLVLPPKLMEGEKGVCGLAYSYKFCRNREFNRGYRLSFDLKGTCCAYCANREKCKYRCLNNPEICGYCWGHRKEHGDEGYSIFRPIGAGERSKRIESQGAEVKPDD